MSFSILEAARTRGPRLGLIVAASEDAPEEVLSYDQLAERARPVLAWLRSHAGLRSAAAEPTAEGAFGGIPPTSGARVALVCHPDADHVVTLLALIELGIPAVLLHPRFTADERAEALAAAPCTLVIDRLPSSLRRSKDPATPTVTLPRVPFIPESASRLEVVTAGAAVLTDPPRLPDDERLCVVVFTSGSTGAPKAVALSRAALGAAARSSDANVPLGEDDRWLQPLSFAHVGGLMVLLRCLRARATAVLAPSGSAAAAHNAMRRYGITVASVVPTQLHRLLALPGLTWLPDLRAMLVGGAAAPPALLARADAAGLPVLATYGMTESAAQVATERMGTRHRGTAPLLPPLPGVEVTVTPGGHIAVRGEQLFDGYLERGRIRSVLDGRGFFITRDAGRIDSEGRLEVLGRLDWAITTGGEKVVPGEVEQALGGVYGVEAVCVFGTHDDEWGQIVCAALVSASEPPPTDGELSAALGRLARWKRPRRIAWLRDLPTRSGGKIDRIATAAAARPLLRAFPQKPGFTP